MDQLFVEIEITTTRGETEILTSVPSLVALYVFKYLRTPANIKLNFVRSSFPSGQAKLKLNSAKLRRELTEERILDKSGTTIQALHDLRLPIYIKDNGSTNISGMCAVCREMVTQQDHYAFKKLLGFKEGCLLAPAEASIWTRFCEVDMPAALNRILTSTNVKELPVELPRFEGHMNMPVRMHNIYKLAREEANKQQLQRAAKKGKKASKVVIQCTTPKEELLIEHTFAEGVVFTLADLILYPCFSLIFQRFQGAQVQFPLVSTWLCEIDNFDPLCQKLLDLLLTNAEPLPLQPPYEIPAFECTSLYKSDPKRYKPRNRIYTEQAEVDIALAKLQELQLEFRSESAVTYEHQHIDWSLIEPQHAKHSALPAERLERKRRQLENLANAVVALAQDGDRIVDFCSGTGHLGILLARLLPRCTIILLENKSISLQRARLRVVELGLSNCCFYQCNLDYFEGSFDIGTSLHACGTATDIVLQKCLQSRAKFVCCPCCYGSVTPMAHISYPRSSCFRAVLTEKQLLHLAHTADQAHELGTLNCKPETTRQGQLCMDILDTDRKLHAEEAGYEVVLTRLKPENCTPKNRLLVGTPRMVS